MQLKEFMVTLVLVVLVATAASTAIYQLNNEYPKADLNISVVDQFGEATTDLEETTSSLYSTTKDTGISAGGLSGVLFSGVGSFMSLLLNMVTLPIQWIGLAAETLGVPSWVVILTGTLLILTVVFAVAAAVLRRMP